ncbi:MAG TPA: beta-propeller domain-containing protein, partial [Lacipirellulaceae bacterium]|nr:beta-propeller domain-containing protein [Lacipirellulaceae bacterium]
VCTVDGIAPNEQMYSVRFVEDRVFFVTFRQVDPLFAVDLSDPENPEIVGELHIPGFSDYLQPMDENHLLAIGRNADEATGWFHELQVSIFDVSDLSDPQLAHRYSFDGGRSTVTPVAGDRWIRGDGDHHAVSYFASEQIFAIPIYTAEENSVWWDGDQATSMFEPGHGGLQLFRIDVDAGFVPLGVIEHDALVERSVKIGDHMYAISSGAVSVHELTNPSARLGEVSIAAESDLEPVALKMYEAPVEIVTLQSDEARSERPTRRADWSPVAPARTQSVQPAPDRMQYVPPARAAAFASLSRSPLRDADLVNAIAIDKTSALNVVLMDDTGAFEEPTDDDSIGHFDDSEKAEQQAQPGHTPFRPISTRFASPLLSV